MKNHENRKKLNKPMFFTRELKKPNMQLDKVCDGKLQISLCYSKCSACWKSTFQLRFFQIHNTHFFKRNNSYMRAELNSELNCISTFIRFLYNYILLLLYNLWFSVLWNALGLSGNEIFSSDFICYKFVS